MNKGDVDKDYKIIILGDSQVGKTSIIARYTHNTFETSLMPTIGSDFQSRIITIDDKLVKLNIWDTAGQELYRSLLLHIIGKHQERCLFSM
jgi:small GTP-binding protein